MGSTTADISRAGDEKKPPAALCTRVFALPSPAPLKPGPLELPGRQSHYKGVRARRIVSVQTVPEADCPSVKYAVVVLSRPRRSRKISSGTMYLIQLAVDYGAPVLYVQDNSFNLTHQTKAQC